MSNRSVVCGNCGSVLPADAVHDPVEARTPCPNCGSSARTTQILLSANEVGLASGTGAAFNPTIKVTGSVDRKLDDDTLSAGGVVETTKAADFHFAVLLDRLENGWALRVVNEHTGETLAWWNTGSADDAAIAVAVNVKDLLPPD